MRTGQEGIRKGMTEGLDRCGAAYEYAQAGRRVALISSGDIGVYGMASPTYDQIVADRQAVNASAAP